MWKWWCSVSLALLGIAYTYLAWLSFHLPETVVYADSGAPAASVTVPAAVMVDAQVADTWTVREVAEDELVAMEKAIGRKAYPFAYHEKFIYGVTAMTTYHWQDGVLVLDVYLRPVYQGERFARAVASHEVAHTYAIAYLDDFTEETANSISVCFAKTSEPYDVTQEECASLKEMLQEK